MKFVNDKGFINDDAIKNFIAGQFAQLLDENEEYFSDFSISLTDTRQFATIDKLEPNRIYLILKFGSATIEFGQANIPITIEAISESNSISACKDLLYGYVAKYNLAENFDSSFRQYYTSPEQNSLFEEVYEGFRATFSVAGTLLISEDANPMKIEYKIGENEYEEIENFDYTTSLNISVDPRVPYGNDNFSESVGQYGTQTLGFMMYLTTSNFSKKIIEAYMRESSVDEDYVLKISFPNIDKEKEFTFKLVDLTIKKDLKSHPIANVTFSC